MIFKASAKINLGLHILGKREDGFHELESIFQAIPLFDFVELIPSTEDSFHSYHKEIPESGGDNLCSQALSLLRNKGYTIPPYEIHLMKNIPIGAGLGGGSSDAVAVLKGLNQLENLQLSTKELKEFAAELGSDCPFFCDNSTALVKGRGEQLKPIDFKLNGKFIHLVYPNIHISTKTAYSSLDLEKTTKTNISLPKSSAEWSTSFTNDFEICLWKQHPELKEIKSQLLHAGAFYASLSGSGSSVFGILETRPEKKIFKENGYEEWILEL